jgi:hypothetical protein
MGEGLWVPLTTTPTELPSRHPKSPRTISGLSLVKHYPKPAPLSNLIILDGSNIDSFKGYQFKVKSDQREGKRASNVAQARLQCLERVCPLQTLEHEASQIYFCSRYCH